MSVSNVKLSECENFLAIDTETTGLNRYTDRIITCAVVNLTPEGIDSYTVKVNPGVPIHPKASEVNGFTDESVKAFGPQEDLLPVLEAIEAAWEAGTPLVGHNVTFDLRFLSSVSVRLRQRPLEVTGPVLDTMVLARMAGMRKATLSAVAAAVQIDQFKPHTAEEDALVSLQILSRLRPSFGEETLGALYTAQKVFDRGFRSGWADDEGEWPL